MYARSPGTKWKRVVGRPCRCSCSNSTTLDLGGLEVEVANEATSGGSEDPGRNADEEDIS